MRFQRSYEVLQKLSTPAPKDEEEFIALLERTQVQRSELHDFGDSAIAFAAFALEAFLYDYAARALGDSFADAHLDRLDPLSKLVVIPRLTSGAIFPKGGIAFDAARKLITARNQLAHSKSQALTIERLESMKRTDWISELKTDVDNIPIAIGEVGKALSTVDPNGQAVSMLRWDPELFRDAV